MGGWAHCAAWSVCGEWNCALWGRCVCLLLLLLLLRMHETIFSVCLASAARPHAVFVDLTCVQLARRTLHAAHARARNAWRA